RNHRLRRQHLQLLAHARAIRRVRRWSEERPLRGDARARYRDGVLGAALMPPDLRACVTDALRALDVRNLTVCVHDASFPSDAGEDIGRGSPCSRGGLRFLHFARALGFTGLQLGPDGQTPPDDPSPYRGAAFPRNTLSIALAPLAEDAEWAGLLPAEDFARAVAARPAGAREHAAHGQAREIQGRAASCAPYGRRRIDRVLPLRAVRRTDPATAVRRGGRGARPPPVRGPPDRAVGRGRVVPPRALPRRLPHGRAAEPDQSRRPGV